MKRIDFLKSLGFKRQKKTLVKEDDHGQVILSMQGDKIMEVTIDAKYDIKSLYELKSILSILPAAHTPITKEQATNYLHRPVIYKKGAGKQIRMLERVTDKYARFEDGGFAEMKGYGTEWQLYREI